MRNRREKRRKEEAYCIFFSAPGGTGGKEPVPPGHVTVGRDPPRGKIDAARQIFVLRLFS
jgi:hypothetical protein